MAFDSGGKRRLDKSMRLKGYRENLIGYIFISPWLIGFFVFTLLPILASFIFSLTDYDLMGSPTWVGLKNYHDIFFNDRRFWRAIRVTFSYVLIHVPLKLIFALLIALLFCRNRKMVSFYRSLFYIPSVIGGSVSVSVLWRKMFGVDGAVNGVLIALGILDEGVAWLGEPSTAIWTIILLAVWQFGSPMLIFLAGLKQIPASYYESAVIDGAGPISRFFRITLPMLSPVILFNFIMQTITGFRAFTESYIITEGGPYDSTLLYMVYLFQKAFKFNSMGYGCALSWILLFIIAVITFLSFKFTASRVYYEARGNW